MIGWGWLAGVFGSSFLAATILPLSSEAAVAGAIVGGGGWLGCLFAATLGNGLGSLTTYGLGYLGKQEWLERWCRMDEEQIQRLRRRIGRYGALASFLCFLPLIGDGLAIALGFMRYRPWRFALWMGLGKFLRYALLIYLVEKGLQAW